MGTPKWKGTFGIGRTADASSVATPAIYPRYETADIKGVPVTFEDNPVMSPDLHAIEAAGKNWTFEANNMRLPAYHMGYLLWLALGTESFGSGTHTLTPADAAQYFNGKLGRGLDLDTVTGGEQPVQNLVGAKIARLAIEQNARAYATVSIGGAGCNVAAPTAALTPTILTGPENAPLSWPALRAGWLKTSYAGGAFAQDNSVQGVKIEYTREQDAEAGIDIESDQPDAVNDGARNVMVEITREFTGAGAQADYDAWMNSKSVGTDLKWVMGTSPAYEVNIVVPLARPVDNQPGPIGVGAESIKGTLVLKAYRGALSLIYAVVKDQIAVAYT